MGWLILVIINTLPVAKGLFTRFMNPGQRNWTNSVLDYGLIDGDSIRNVSSFVIDDQARYRCGSDHALLECDVMFSGSPRVRWTYNEVISYNIHDKTNYTLYKSTLDAKIGQTSLAEFSSKSPADMLPLIVDAVNSSAQRTIGKTWQKPWLNIRMSNICKFSDLHDYKVVSPVFQGSPNSKFLAHYPRFLPIWWVVIYEFQRYVT